MASELRLRPLRPDDRAAALAAHDAMEPNAGTLPCRWRNYVAPSTHGHQPYLQHDVIARRLL